VNFVLGTVVPGIAGAALGAAAGQPVAGLVDRFATTPAGTRTGAGRATPAEASPGRTSPGRASLACAAVLGALGARVGAQYALPAYVYLAAVGVPLAMIDFRARRLPDRIILPSYGVVGAALTFASLAEGAFAALVRAVVAMAVLFAAYFAVSALTRGAAVGFGDVKLAGLLGLSLGWAGWDQVVFGVFAAHALAGLVVAGLALRGRAWRGRTVAFGPFLLAGWAGTIALLPPAP
jgi:leader peptidase (prepilin peptidase)/N-methyltransferase